MPFGRLVTAMITPFTETLKIDWINLRKLIDHLILTGTDSIVVAGTTAESATLTDDEKRELFKFTLTEVAGRVKVIAATGSNNTEKSIQLTKDAEAIGVDGVMIVAPYYNKPSQIGLYQHYKQISKVTPLPIMVYNIPGRTGVNISVNTLVHLSQIENIVAIKEASGDLMQIAQLISQLPKDVVVYSGDDNLTLPILSIGGTGVVSVASHIWGYKIKKMIHAYNAGDVDKAKEIYHLLLPAFHGLFITSNPVPVKYVLSKKGFCKPLVRSPLVEMTESEKELTKLWMKDI